MRRSVWSPCLPDISSAPGPAAAGGVASAPAGSGQANQNAAKKYKNKNKMWPVPFPDAAWRAQKGLTVNLGTLGTPSETEMC